MVLNLRRLPPRSTKPDYAQVHWELDFLFLIGVETHCECHNVFRVHLTTLAETKWRTKICMLALLLVINEQLMHRFGILIRAGNYRKTEE